jgi:hypothetical protein
MVNLIGAYIVTLGLIGLVSKRPDFSAFEQSLQEFCGIRRVAFAVFLALLLPACFDLGESISLLKPFGIASWLFSGLNLWIHEAGHFYFSWDGQVLHSLGGTLNELIFPGVFMAFAWKRGRPVSFWLGVYWIAFNLIGIGRYMADARAQVLPLLGGGTHDWLVVFGAFGLLDYDVTIGGLTRALGVALALLACGVLTFSVPPFPQSSPEKEGSPEL